MKHRNSFVIKLSILMALMPMLCTTAFAQIEEAANSVFTLTTFKADGSILASGHGVFVGNSGEAIGIWKPFVGASSAVVVDAKGNKMDVESVIGANELYDVCKFRVKGRTAGARVATVPSPKGSKAWLLGYSVRKADISQRNVQNTEKFMDKYTYYIFSSTVPENAEGCPFVNAKGEVIGLLQHSKTGSDVYATDAQLANSFKVENGLAINSSVLRQTSIRIDFPQSSEQAQIMLMLSAQQPDSMLHVKYVDAFISQFPTSIDGYTQRAQSQLNADQFSNAAATMETAIQKVTKKDEAHSNYSRLIFQKEIYKADKPFAAWNLDKALDEAKQAYSINALPTYQHQQAQIYFAKGEYQTAYDMFMALTKSNIRSGEFFYEAAQCKQQLKAPQNEYMALLDSAIAASPQPLNAVGAPYVLARGNAWLNAGEFRKAVDDFNQYDSLMQGRPLSSDFYFAREQAELKIHQYQQAVNDINRAVYLDYKNPLLWAEKASLHLRFNQLDDAIKSADASIRFNPKSTDGYVIKGVALIHQKKKAEGIEALNKAKELGDPRADEYLKKYK